MIAVYMRWQHILSDGERRSANIHAYMIDGYFVSDIDNHDVYNR